MTTAARQIFSFQEYVRLDAESNVKHEFLSGEAWAMAGGSHEHAAVSASIIALLVNAQRGKPCRAYSSDLRVRVAVTGLTTYPDVTVICGAVELDPADPRKQTAVNPSVLVEVLSPSTEAYDRGEKLAHYQQIASLKEVVLVAHDRRQVEVVRREPDGTWSRWIARDEESARLESIDCDLPLGEIYGTPLA